MTGEVIIMAGVLRVPRSRGALSGLLLVLLGIWGALIPFVGPYFGYKYTPATTWTYTTGRLWLEILPGAAVVLGGLITMASATRPVAMFGAWLAAVSGLWFVIGEPVSRLWTTSRLPAAGHPASYKLVIRVVEELGFFTGLGAVIIFLAAFALGRLAVIGAREAAVAAVPPARGPVAYRREARAPVTTRAADEETTASPAVEQPATTDETAGRHAAP